MPKSLAEIRASKHVGRPERTYPICVAGPLVAEISALDDELLRATEEEKSAPKRVATKSKAQAIAKRADALRDEMVEHIVQVRLRAVPNGDWRRWCQAHPARDNEDRDKLFTAPICNSDDLIAALCAPVDLPPHGDPNLLPVVARLGDDEPEKGDFAFIVDNASPGDLLGLARVVMGMHETAVDAPKSRLAWLREQTSADDSE